MNDPMNMPAAAVVGGRCGIGWCEREHPAPGRLDQVYVSHQAEVAAMTVIGGTTVEVSASWWERLDDRPPRDPEVRVCTYTGEERAAVDLAPGTALLAEVMALTDVGSWLGRPLGGAAALLGYRLAGDEFGGEAADVEREDQ